MRENFCRGCTARDFDPDGCDDSCKPCQEGQTSCLGYYFDAPKGNGCEYCYKIDSCYDKSCDNMPYDEEDML